MATQFSQTARSERYFTALLLPHLLMADNFAGARALFEELGLYASLESNSDSVEIVAELNPLRDVKPEKANLRNEAPPQRQVVPDLFVRMGNSALVIEAKFFTHPSASAVADQLASQREAIKTVLPFTQYSDCKFHFMALTVLPLEDIPNWGEDTYRRTWSQIISVLESVVMANATEDNKYALRVLKDAVHRSEEEADTSSKEKGRLTSIGKLLERSPKLIEAGNFFVGFTGGERALGESSIEDMEKRQHYKYSDCQPNKNWLPIHVVISHYLKLKTEAKVKSEE